VGEEFGPHHKFFLDPHRMKILIVIFSLHLSINGFTQYSGGLGCGEEVDFINDFGLDGNPYDELYKGGMGRGDLSSGALANGLNGNIFSHHFTGGLGRGDQSALEFALNLSGESFHYHSKGGPGRGDHQFMVNATSLSGDSYLISSSGGPGRGDHSFIQDASSLNGEEYGAHYSGGLGRGDHVVLVPETTINGELTGQMFSGGPGRGEDENISFAQILHCSNYALWTGVISSAWHNPGNWICNQLPHRYSDVIIPPGVPNFPYLTGSNATISNLTLQSNSQLHILGVNLSVLGN